MTVGELKKLLESYPDSLTVVIGYTPGDDEGEEYPEQYDGILPPRRDEVRLSYMNDRKTDVLVFHHD